MIAEGPKYTNGRPNRNSDQQTNRSHPFDRYNCLWSISSPCLNRVVWKGPPAHLRLPLYSAHFFRPPVHEVTFCALQPILFPSQSMPSLHQRTDCVPLKHTWNFRQSSRSGKKPSSSKDNGLGNRSCTWRCRVTDAIRTRFRHVLDAGWFAFDGI